MPLELTKQTLAAAWVVTAGIVGLATGIGSISQLILLEAVALGPPIIMLLLWRRPTPLAGRTLDGRR
jgi:hypothetical protein